MSADPNQPGAPPESPLAEHFFRDQYGQLVATLVRVAGFQHLEVAEDAVHAAFTTALENWRSDGVPRVAYNRLVGDLRQRATRLRILEGAASDAAESDDPSTPFFAGEVRDDLLRMLFVCCHDAIPM